MNAKKLYVFTDGGARGNPGPAAIGFVVKDDHGKVLQEGSEFIGRATNNVAEYQAVVKALEWLINNYQIIKLSNDQINFYLDSKLVVNQLGGYYKIKDAKLRNLVIKIKNLEQKIKAKIFYYFISRQKNQRADFLVNQKLNQRGF